MTGFWFENITALHHAMALGLDDCLKNGNVPDWMVKERTVLIHKDSAKGLSMAWVNYKKAYDMVSHSCLLDVVEMMGVADNVRSLLEARCGQHKERNCPWRFLISPAVCYGYGSFVNDP